MIRSRLSERGICIDSPSDALKQLLSDGYDDIVFTSTHLIPGTEYDSLLSAANGLRYIGSKT